MNWISWSRRFEMQPKCWLRGEGSVRSPFILSKIVSLNIHFGPSHKVRKRPFRYLPRNRSFLLRQNVKRILDREALNYGSLSANKRRVFHEGLHCFSRTLSRVRICVGARRYGSDGLPNRAVEA